MTPLRLGRGGRIVLLSFSAMVVVLLVVAGAGLFVAQSNWLRERLRTAILSQLETATGGRVEAGSFQFDWHRLTAELNHLVIHGKETPDQAPLLTIDQLVVGLKVISLIRRDIDVSNISVAHPQVHLIFYPGGGTNVPEPKMKRMTSESPIKNILDLKIGQFDLRDGFVLAEAPRGKRHRGAFQTKAENLAARIDYDPSGVRYLGSISIAPLHFESKETGPLDFRIDTKLALEKNRLSLAKASVATPHSEVDFTDLIVNGFTDPVMTAEVATRVSIDELGRIVHWPSHQSGIASLRGSARFTSLQDFELKGKVHCDAFDLGILSPSFLLRGARVDANVVVHPERIDLAGIHVAALGGIVEGRGEILHWDHFQASGPMHGLTMRTGAATFTKYVLPYDAQIEGTYEVSGDFTRITETLVTARANLVPAAGSAPVNGFADVTYDGVADSLTFGNSFVQLPHTRVDASGVLDRHLDVKAVSTQPEEILPFSNVKVLPIKLQNGSATFVGTIDGPTPNPVIEGQAELRNVVYEGQRFDAASGHVKLLGSGVTLTAGRLTHDSFQADGDGAVAFSDWGLPGNSPIQGHLRVNDANLTRLLAVAKQKDIPLKGTLNATGSVSGTLENPRITADVHASHGEFSGEPYDSINAHIESPSASTQTAAGEIVAGPSHATVHALYTHSAENALPGKLSFQVESNPMALNKIVTFHNEQPNVNGLATLKADGEVAITEDAGKLIHYSFSKLDGNLNLTGLQAAGWALGDAHVTAVTHNDVMTARLSSNLVQASVAGAATIRLSGDYPMESHISISKVDLNTLWKLANPQMAAESFNFGGATEGTLTLNGPLAKPDQMTGSLELPRFELRPLQALGTGTTSNVPRSLQTFVLKNAGPLRASLSRSFVHFDEVRFEGPSTNLSLTGTVALRQNSALDLRAQGDVNMEILEGFSADLTAAGGLTVNAALRGTLLNPDFSGRAELKNGDFHIADFSNGLTSARGVILFNGSRATIQSLAADSGGGKVDATGFLAVTQGLLAFNLDTRARQVRVRYPEGVSTVADANLTLAGTSQRSQASGQVRIHRITINPRSEVGGVLTKSVEPVRTPSASTGLLANLNLDVQIETAPDVAFQTNLAQTLQAEASMRLRGTATNPALLGRVTVTEGEIVFFGNKYTITQGTISFFNPAKVDPILNVDLETKARGVQIIITVSGPVDKPLNVTYRSDPPLQFSDIVALLATGRSPTDPSIALRDTTGNQSLQQLGASALLGQAIANPVSGRLQRFFGVSKLKIDPALSGITGSPQARLTIEQQVTPDILFTYITDVSSTSTQLIRVEWAFNKTWSGILTREENGYVGLDFAYKKRFK